MEMRFASLALLATSIIALSGFSAGANQANPVRPRFAVIPANAPWHAETSRFQAARQPNVRISQWNGSFTDVAGNTITFDMIGPDPSSNNGTTVIPFKIVPVIVAYPASGGVTFDPKTDTYSDGETVLRNFTHSPLLDSNVDFTSAGQDLGKGQYIDEFQRGNFWGANVQKNSDYHVVLGKPVILKALKIRVKNSQYGIVETNPFGTQPVGTYLLGAMDLHINQYIQAHAEITPDQFVFFMTHNIFLTYGGNCCIGGYHTATNVQPGSQTYGYATLVTDPGSFSQDVSAASHEIGEWMDDPFTDNVVGCQDDHLMEVGEPLLNAPNYGAFPYGDHGFTYNLQDLVYLGYFGAPPNTSVGSQLSFNNLEQSVCPGQ